MENEKMKIGLKLIAILILWIPAFAGMVMSQDNYTAGKNLAPGDTSFVTSFGLSPGDYSLFRISVENPHATLTDSVVIFHISTRVIYGGDTVKADTVPVRFKQLSETGQSVQNDTLYQILVVPPANSREVFIYYPNPDNLYFVMSNAQYSTGRRAYLKVRGFNR